MSAKKEGPKDAAQPDLSKTEVHVLPVTKPKLEGEGPFGPWRPNIPGTKELFLEKPFCEQVVTVYKLLIEVYEQFGSLSRGKNRWTASPCQKAVQRVSDSLRGLESHYRIFSQSSERKIHGTLYTEHMNLTKDCENKCSSQSAKKDKKDKYSTYERFCAIQGIFLNEHHKK